MKLIYTFSVYFIFNLFLAFFSAGLYEKAHKAIRKDPNVARGPLAKGYFGKREKALPKDIKHANKRFHRQKISVQQKIARIQQKLLARGVVPNKTKPY